MDQMIVYNFAARDPNVCIVSGVNKGLSWLESERPGRPVFRQGMIESVFMTGRNDNLYLRTPRPDVKSVNVVLPDNHRALLESKVSSLVVLHNHGQQKIREWLTEGLLDGIWQITGDQPGPDEMDDQDAITTFHAMSRDYWARPQGGGPWMFLEWNHTRDIDGPIVCWRVPSMAELNPSKRGFKV